MKKVLASTIIGCPLGCMGSVLLVAVIVIATLASLASCGAGILKAGIRGIPYAYASLSGSSIEVALDAIALDSHLSGDRLQNYNPSDPFMRKVISYWLPTCHNKDGSLCEVASNGDLQCVEFVTGAFLLAGISLPYAPDAHYFWPDYQNKQAQSDWQEIPAGSGLPEMGDIVVWKTWHYDAKQKVRVEDAGHVAIVVAVIPPQGNTQGRVYLAQANASSSITVRQALNQDAKGALVNILGEATLNARLGELTIYPNLSVADDKALENDPTSSGSVVDGYIRHISPLSTTVLKLSGSQTCDTSHMPHIFDRRWVPVACYDAQTYHISSQLFINQIYLESEFNPNAVSDTGAEGIAQFEPYTAGGRFNPFDPVAALDAAAYLMSDYYCGYLSGDFTDYVDGRLGLSDCDAVVATRSPSQKSVAYEKALAAYNGGPGAVSRAVAECGNVSWHQCLGSDIQFYIDFIISL